MSIRHCVLAAIALVGVLTIGQAASAQAIPGERLGVVLLHGKGGQPGPAGLAAALRKAGVLVETPEMPWSRRRIYAKSYEDSMAEIDAAVERLRKAGAKRVLVGGQSMGANVALGYGARRDGLAGILLLAPGHMPGRPKFDSRVASGVAKAKQMIAQGKGSARATFPDVNQGRVLSVTTNAEIYLSWFSPDGPAVWTWNAAKVKAPVFCADGSGEPNPACAYATAMVPATRVRVQAGHLGVADTASGQVLVWVRSLP